MEVQFKDWKCNAVFAKYHGNGRVAIQLVDTEDGSPVATATVNLPNDPLDVGAVFVKSYAENEGMTDALCEAGIIKPEVLSSVQSGHVSVSSFKLTEEAMKEACAVE